jgi:hypothetical protein
MRFHTVGGGQWTAPSIDISGYLARVRNFMADERYLAALAVKHKVDASAIAESVTNLRYSPQEHRRDGLWWRREYCCVEVGFAARDPLTAHNVDRDLVDRVLDSDHDRDLRRLTPHPDPCPEGATCDDTGFEFIEPATLPTHPTPDPLAFAILGAVLGLIAGIVWETGRKRGAS